MKRKAELLIAFFVTTVTTSSLCVFFKPYSCWNQKWLSFTTNIEPRQPLIEISLPIINLCGFVKIELCGVLASTGTIWNNGEIKIWFNPYPLEPEAIIVYHQYTASLHIHAVWLGSILLSDQLQVLILISLKL